MKANIPIILVLFLMFSCKQEVSKSPSVSENSINQDLSIRINKEPGSLSPILARTSISRQVYRLIFSKLMEINPKSLKLEPQLARAAPIIEPIESGPFKGGKKFTYEIREEAVWDNGTPILATDYVFSSKLMLHPNIKTRYGPVADLIEDIILYSDNPRKLSILTGKCHISTEETISSVFFYPEYHLDPLLSLRKKDFIDFKDKEKIKIYIQADTAMTAVGELFSSPEYARVPGKIISAGPYELKEWITGQRITLSKKENWWGESNFVANPSQIIFEIIPDNTTALTRLINNEIDLSGDIPSDVFVEYKENKNLAIHRYNSTGIFYLALNNESPILSDKRIRQALSHSIDLDVITKNVCDGYATPISGPYSPAAKFYDQSLKPKKYNLELATKILAEAGWKDSNNNTVLDKKIDGKTTELRLEFILDARTQRALMIAELLKNNCAKIGIDIALIKKEPNIYRKENLSKGKYDIVITGTSASPGLYDPKGRWHSESIPPTGGNYPRFQNDRADELIDEIRSECTDDSKRSEMYKELHKIMYKEQPVIFLYNRDILMLSSNKISQLVTSSARPGFFPEYVQIVK